MSEILRKAKQALNAIAMGAVASIVLYAIYTQVGLYASIALVGALVVTYLTYEFKEEAE